MLFILKKSEVSVRLDNKTGCSKGMLCNGMEGFRLADCGGMYLLEKASGKSQLLFVCLLQGFLCQGTLNISWMVNL